jgi:hypothetical protein
VSKDDSDDLGSSGLNPLDGDLLGDLGALPPAGESGMPEETMGLSPGLAATTTAEPAVDEVEEKVEEESEPQEKGPGFLARLSESNPYTVMLVVSLVALLIAICCLLLEWSSYGFDTKAKGLQQSASAAAPTRTTGPMTDLQIG